MNVQNIMEKIKVRNTIGSTGFKFIGSDWTFLNYICDGHFVLKQYDGGLYIDYGFNGIPIAQFDSSKYDYDMGSIDDASNDKIENVMEIYSVTYRFKERVLTVDDIDYTNKDTFKDFFKKLPCGELRREKWKWGNKVLTRWASMHCDSQVFVISSKLSNKILSIAYSEHFGDGDSETRVFLLDMKNILMWNPGDHPSVLFIDNLIY